jgi:exodeoxyribonuclease V gamma subunit
MPLRRFTVVTADRLSPLVARLAGDLARDPLPPLAEELVVVQSQGMRRWLQLELARRHGCAASLRLPFPAAFCRRLADTIQPLGAQPDRFALGDDDPFDREVLTWRIRDLFERGLYQQDGFTALKRFCEGDVRQRLGLAARIARVFDDYLLYRPDLLEAWERGELRLGGHPHERWQAELWRLLRDGQEADHMARRLGRLIADLESRADRPAGLPERIGVFGVSSLPPVFVELLRAAARFVPVTLYVACGAETLGHPLGDGWGEQGRDFLAILDHPDTLRERIDSPPRPAAGVLQALQADVLAARERARDDRRPIASDDDTLTLHVCHSPLREMEVLRDRLLAAFDADPSLRPHEVLVMVPDVTTYHPYVEAVFGATGDGVPSIPFHVADRPLAREFSLARHVLDLLGLVDGRRTVTEVLALLDAPAIRRRARIAESDVPALHDWAEATRVRWGTDGDERKRLFDLPAVDANTWRVGLDRLLMGYATGPVEALVAGVLPHGGHTAGDARLLGRFTAWVDALFDTLDGLRRDRPLAAWRTALLDLLDRLVEADGESEERALSLVREQLETLALMQVRAQHERPVELAVVRDWLQTVLADDSLGSGFLAGGVTFAALKPMRAIPFKVVAICGLDDASFPRRDRPPAFDLIGAAPRQGDRSLRADDRQLFLDTLLAAADRVILTWVGRSATDNAERAPSVVIAELLDHLDRVCAVEGAPAPAARARLVVEHRLQPFSPEYYRGQGPLFSYSAANATACAAAGAAGAEPEPFVTVEALQAEIAPAEPLALTLTDLIDCWLHPSRFWCRRALRLTVEDEEGGAEEDEPFEVDGIPRYALQQDMVRRRVRRRENRTAEAALVAAGGDLPPGELAPAWHRVLAAEADAFVARLGVVDWLEPVALQLEGRGWTLRGRVDGCTTEGRLQYRAATLKPGDRVRAWITHLALAAHLGDPDLITRLVGRDDEVLWGVPDDPKALLDELVAGYREALRAPLPVFEAASWEYTRPRTRATKQLPLEAARKKFALHENFQTKRTDGDLADAYVALCWRGRDPFANDGAEFVRWSECLWAPAHQHVVKA